MLIATWSGEHSPGKLFVELLAIMWKSLTATAQNMRISRIEMVFSWPDQADECQERCAEAAHL
jgi:hypothetical protein